MDTVVAFTDSYLPTVNGVTYTIQTWRDRWRDRGGQMPVVYPDGPHPREAGEHPVWSLPFPFYDSYRVGLPRVPNTVPAADVVHVHTPVTLGVAGLRYARKADVPLVISYHTPTSEYTNYLAPHRLIADKLRHISKRWERWFFNHADLVLAPTTSTREHLLDELGVTSPVTVLSNGVDVDLFRPVETVDFRARYGLETDKPLVGYTGRHGYEKSLSELITATADLPVTLVFGGDGPARPELQAQAREQGVDARFLGFLDRSDLPAFYSSLDLFAFPSPVETQGLVALESVACGTPVVGANDGALAETIVDGTMGYTYASGDIEDFQSKIRRGLAERERLEEQCLALRDEISVDHTVEALAEHYATLH